MNDLPAVLQHSHMNLCTVQACLNHDLSLIFHWVILSSNGFKVNVSKSPSILLAKRHHRVKLSSIQLFLDNNLTYPKVVLNIFVSL